MTTVSEPSDERIKTRFVLVWWRDGSRHETEFPTLGAALSWVRDREGEQATWAQEIRKHTEVVMDMDVLLSQKERASG